MNIGYFTSIDGWGGSETYLKSLMLGVRERGHAPVLFGVEGSRLLAEMKRENVPCVAWPQTLNDAPFSATPVPEAFPPASRRDLKSRLLRLCPLWCKLALGNLAESRRLRRLFRQRPVDVLHVGIHGYEMAGLAARSCGIPALAMCMITPIDEPHRFRRWLIRNTIRAYDHVSSQSSSCTDAWIRLAGLAREHTSFVWNGVDLARFAAGCKAPREQGPLRLVSVGRLHPMKGFAHLVDAMRALDPNFAVLDILGDGPQREELERQIRLRNLSSRVRLHGHVEAPERFMRNADVFVLASVSHESCPAVLCEAMAMRLPLITSDFGPLPEINVAGETGLVAPAGDSAALAGAIRRLGGDPALRAAFGQAARRRAETCFGRERMIERTLELYVRLAKRRKVT